MLVLLWQEISQSTGGAETSTPEEQCSGWWRGQGELQPAQHLWSPPSILHDLKCLKIPRHVVAYIFAIRVISTTICACGISWLVTRVYYLCLEPSVFRLLNKYFGFSGRAEKKKNFCEKGTPVDRAFIYRRHLNLSLSPRMQPSHVSTGHIVLVIFYWNDQRCWQFICCANHRKPCSPPHLAVQPFSFGRE